MLRVIPLFMLVAVGVSIRTLSNVYQSVQLFHQPINYNSLITAKRNLLVHVFQHLGKLLMCFFNRWQFPNLGNPRSQLFQLITVLEISKPVLPSFFPLVCQGQGILHVFLVLTQGQNQAILFLVFHPELSQPLGWPSVLDHEADDGNNSDQILHGISNLPLSGKAYVQGFPCTYGKSR